MSVTVYSTVRYDRIIPPCQTFLKPVKMQNHLNGGYYYMHLVEIKGLKLRYMIYMIV